MAKLIVIGAVRTLFFTSVTTPVYHCVLPKGWFEKLTQKNLKCYQMAKFEWRRYGGGEQTHHPRMGLMDC